MMKTATIFLSCILAMSLLAVGCSDDDGNTQTGSGGASGTGGSAGSTGGATNNGGSGGGASGTGGSAGSTGGATNNGGTGGGTGLPVQCPGGSPTCDENTAWFCDGALPTMSPCGNTQCQAGECVCTSDDQCKADEDKSWVECACVDGQTVKKTGNELASCDPSTSKCAKLKMDTVCDAVCKDNGGSGTLSDMHFEM